MSEEHELPSDSDDDDEDYVPEGAEEPVSEAESEGEDESAPEDENNENRQLSKKGSKKRRSRGKINNAKRKKSDKNSKDHDDSTEDNETTETKKLTEEEEKKKADSLWADFMKDTGAPLKPKVSKPTNGKTENAPIIRPKVEEKVKITKIFEFAGEEVKVEKEVPADSAEARLILSTSEKSSSNSSAQSNEKNSSTRGGKRGGGLGGISSVLNQIGKKAKISTLEKSKLDWDNFKRDEKLDEEITTHNRGKSGFLERQDFLQRTDVRQFEIEKNLRTTTRRSNR